MFKVTAKIEDSTGVEIIRKAFIFAADVAVFKQEIRESAERGSVIDFTVVSTF
jgi:hypothetical protein